MSGKEITVKHARETRIIESSTPWKFLPSHFLRILSAIFQKNSSLACGQGVSAGQPPALGTCVMFRATVMQPRPHPPASREGRWWLVGSISHLIKGGANPCKSPGEKARIACRETSKWLNSYHLWLLFHRLSGLICVFQWLEPQNAPCRNNCCAVAILFYFFLDSLPLMLLRRRLPFPLSNCPIQGGLALFFQQKDDSTEYILVYKVQFIALKDD